MKIITAKNDQIAIIAGLRLLESAFTVHKTHPAHCCMNNAISAIFQAIEEQGYEKPTPEAIDALCNRLSGADTSGDPS